MKYTVQEKYDYNNSKRRKGQRFDDYAFSLGYVIGVEEYRRYPKESKEEKAYIKSIISDAFLYAKDGSEYFKGYACAIRDCANERKNKK